MKTANTKQNGFTLIELMVVIAIVGILSAVAYPSYVSHLRKGHRADAQAYLMDLAQRQNQYFTDSRTYAADVTTLGSPTPSSLTNYYTVSIAVSGTTFTITAEAIGSQLSDGNLTLNNTGTKTPSDKW